MNVAIVQNKPHKGDVARNLSDIETHFRQATAGAAALDLVVLPEACLTGYFLEGGVYDVALPASEAATLVAGAWRRAVSERDAPVGIVFGFFENDGGTFYNAAMYLEVDGKRERIVHLHRKMFLPTYGVFDEERFLSRGTRLQTFNAGSECCAILICEDAWHSIMPAIAAVKGAQYLIIPSASPGRGLAGTGELESIEHWRAALRLYAQEHGMYVIYAGLAGFEGGKGMTGSSCIVDPRGATIASAPLLGPAIVRAELDPREIELARANLPLLGDLRAVWPDLFDEPLAAGAAP